MNLSHRLSSFNCCSLGASTATSSSGPGPPTSIVALAYDVEALTPPLAPAGGRRTPARGLTAEECDRVLAVCCRPRRTGRSIEREDVAVRRGLVDGAIFAFPPPRRRQAGGGSAVIGAIGVRPGGNRRARRRPATDAASRSGGRTDRDAPFVLDGVLYHESDLDLVARPPLTGLNGGQRC